MRGAVPPAINRSVQRRHFTREFKQEAVRQVLVTAPRDRAAPCGVRDPRAGGGGAGWDGLTMTCPPTVNNGWPESNPMTSTVREGFIMTTRHTCIASLVDDGHGGGVSCISIYTLLL